MIIRIVGEGQWQVPDTEMEHLNRIDARVEHAIDIASQNELTEALTELVATVRTVCPRTRSGMALSLDDSVRTAMFRCALNRDCSV